MDVFLEVYLCHLMFCFSSTFRPNHRPKTQAGNKVDDMIHVTQRQLAASRKMKLNSDLKSNGGKVMPLPP